MVQQDRIPLLTDGGVNWWQDRILWFNQFGKEGHLLKFPHSVQVVYTSKPKRALYSVPIWSNSVPRSAYYDAQILTPDD